MNVSISDIIFVSKSINIVLILKISVIFFLNNINKLGLQEYKINIIKK